MRYVAIDLGAKRTGLAVGDSIIGLVQPLKVLDVPEGPRLIDALARAIDDIGPNRIVVGLPINMDGTEGPAARSVRQIGQALATRTGVPVDFQDERLTSFAAESHLDRSGRTHKEKREIRDALAAAEILRDYLRAIAERAAPTTDDTSSDGGVDEEAADGTGT
ncbi:MAG: Holliday junction resolvase RuvX [Phycisphaerae bacterium]|nr:Holliday junction resolvase RuvX [Phycisphaerae bacterium]